MRKTVVVSETERGLLVKDGRLVRVLQPGRHVIWDVRGAYSTILCNMRDQEADTPWAEVIEKRHADLAAGLFETVRAGEGEVAVVSFDGRPSLILCPGETRRFWSVLCTVEVQYIDVVETPRLTSRELAAFERAPRAYGSTMPPIAVYTVDAYEAGLIYFDGVLVDTLGPGRAAYWQVGRKVQFKRLDLRSEPVEVTAQEILTKDRVSVRVTLGAFVQVTDAQAAATATPDYKERVYKLAQFAIREAVGGRTLDELLNDRTAVDAEVAGRVRSELGDIGVAVREIAVKDVILPGEMRTLLNQVVEAEKAAQANLIRRREETAATRSLLNTARLMEDNPTLLRLKEIEALERVTEKVGRIDVHAGDGAGLNALLDRLVSLKA